MRARVAWVQRPHSIREFFQVAVELERPTNVWKSGTLPADWLKAETVFPSVGHENSVATGQPLTSTADPSGAGSVATTLGHYMNATFRDSSRDQGLGAAAEAEAAHPLLRDLRANFERENVVEMPSAAAKFADVREEVHPEAQVWRAMRRM